MEARRRTFTRCPARLWEECKPSNTQSAYAQLALTAKPLNGAGFKGGQGVCFFGVVGVVHGTQRRTTGPNAGRYGPSTFMAMAAHIIRPVTKATKMRASSR